MRQKPKSHKAKRSRFSRKNVLHRYHGEQLIENLRAQQREFPRFAPYLEQVIAKVLSDAQRTRKGDQETVLTLLAEFNEAPLSLRDLVEDTGLSEWDVRQILTELMDAGKAEFVPQPPPGIPVKKWKCERRLYRLKRAKSQTP